MVGDHSLNLGTTTLHATAFMATSGENKYRAHLLDYVDAWCERTAANGGVIPSNIGLDGTIGGAADGKWYGGACEWPPPDSRMRELARDWVDLWLVICALPPPMHRRRLGAQLHSATDWRACLAFGGHPARCLRVRERIYVFERRQVKLY